MKPERWQQLDRMFHSALELETRQDTRRKKAVALQTVKSNRFELAEPTGLEPATSDVTGRRSNQLNYDSAWKPERPDVRDQMSEVSHNVISDLRPLISDFCIL